MKIVALLETPLHAGGAYHQGLNAIKQMDRICAEKYGFEIVTTEQANVSLLQSIGSKTSYYEKTLTDRLFLNFNELSWFRLVQRRFDITSPMEKHLQSMDADLVYFLTQTRLTSMLMHTPYITTLFDICHRDTPEFPEVRENNEFSLRDNYFMNYLPIAALVITDSAELSEKASRIYGINKRRFLSMPYAESELNEENSNSTESVLQKFRLEAGYFFYPAQFWPHKNHARILQALHHLKEQGTIFQAAFAGGDKGNYEFVKSLVNKLGLEEQVHFLGFVEQEDMRGLFLGCKAVVMPTYFGPTNLPPLEAWSLGKPLIYSNHLKSNGGDAAIYADPDSIEDLARAMVDSDNTQIANDIVSKGSEHLGNINKTREQQEEKLAAFLDQFAARLSCWK